MKINKTAKAATVQMTPAELKRILTQSEKFNPKLAASLRQAIKTAQAEAQVPEFMHRVDQMFREMFKMPGGMGDGLKEQLADMVRGAIGNTQSGSPLSGTEPTGGEPNAGLGDLGDDAGAPEGGTVDGVQGLGDGMGPLDESQLGDGIEEPGSGTIGSPEQLGGDVNGLTNDSVDPLKDSQDPTVDPFPDESRQAEDPLDGIGFDGTSGLSEQDDFEASSEGSRAREGLDWNNPHSPDSPKHKSWSRGWNAANDGLDENYSRQARVLQKGLLSKVASNDDFVTKLAKAIKK